MCSSRIIINIIQYTLESANKKEIFNQILFSQKFFKQQFLIVIKRIN